MKTRARFPVMGLTALIAVLSIDVPPLAAQAERSERSGLAVRIAPGFALVGASFGDDNPKSSTTAAFDIGAQLWTSISRVVALNFEAVYQPTSISNPHSFVNESFTVLYLMLGPEFAIGRAYLRPSLGAAFLFFSGIGEDSTEPAIGLAVGTERPIGGEWHISPEVVGRLSFESGLVNYLIGFQVPVGLRP